MSLQFLIDMNLSPEWIDVFNTHGLRSAHWSHIGDPAAEDHKIMEWALTYGYTVFTHDLDFGTMLALTHTTGPSVIQVRSQNPMPEYLGEKVIAAILQHTEALQNGALVVIDEKKSRVRCLPL